MKTIRFPITIIKIARLINAVNKIIYNKSESYYSYKKHYEKLYFLYLRSFVKIADFFNFIYVIYITVNNFRLPVTTF